MSRADVGGVSLNCKNYCGGENDPCTNEGP